MPEFIDISHIDLSVSDAEASAAWYCEDPLPGDAVILPARSERRGHR